MSTPKPHLKTVGGRVVAVEPPGRESPVGAARRRHGKAFGFERGSKFVWESGPSVLTRWLADRITQRMREES